MLPNSDSIEQAIPVSIEKMVYGGEGLARTSEGVVLVPGVITGERAKVFAEEARRGVRHGRLLELSESSQARVEPGCPYFSRCGGCQYQHISYPRQLEIKEQILAECFERIGKFRPEVPIRTVPSQPWNYRNRVRLQIEKLGSNFRVGYLEQGSHAIVAVDVCPIAMPAIEAVVHDLAGGKLAELFPDGLCELELFADEFGRALMGTVYSALLPPAEFGEAWRGAFPQFETLCWSKTLSRTSRARPQDTIWGNGAIVYRLGEFHFRVSHHSFFQTNYTLLQSMQEIAISGHTGRRALDLYAGVGFLTLPLSRRFERVAAVEANPAAVGDLASNAGVMGTRVRAHRKTAEQFLAATSHNWDFVIVDPPRAGLAAPVLAGLECIGAPRLVYVSCDPTTLARDLKQLCASRYRIESIHMLDLFPQTFHIETIVHLTDRR
jgi:23S rRNA (uracil1939-C5)-methyltransferase